MSDTFAIRSASGDIPATIRRPAQARADADADASAPGAPESPAVLLLHGTASSRDEVGGMYRRLADALAIRGITSLRIDFAGCGDSTRAQTDFTVVSQLADAREAFDWLRHDDRIDAARIGLLGFSQGGMIATLLAGDEPAVAALASWSSGIVEGGAFSALGSQFEPAEGGDPRAGAVTLDLGFRTFEFSREWFRQAQSMPLARAIGRYGHPLLAVACSADNVVPPTASLELIRHAASVDIEFRMLAGGDHVFEALNAGSTLADTVIDMTAHWFAARVAPAVRQR